jgi:hypothetical protein
MFIAKITLFCQFVLLGYHQVTTLFDFYPFNGARHLEPKQKLAECGVNGLLMLLPPIGFGLHIRSLMNFGLVYYFVLCAIELIIWWIPYLTTPLAAGGVFTIDCSRGRPPILKRAIRSVTGRIFMIDCTAVRSPFCQIVAVESSPTSNTLFSMLGYSSPRSSRLRPGMSPPNQAARACAR